MCTFNHAALQIFFLSLTFRSLTMICLDVTFFVFILLGICWPSWICKLMLSYNRYFFMFFAPFSQSFSGAPVHLWPFDNFTFTDSFFCHFTFSLEPIWYIFSFQLLCLSALEFPPGSFILYVSLLRFSMCLLNTTIFPLNIFIIVALKLLSPKSNMLALSESVAIDCFFSECFLFLFFSLSLSHNFSVKTGHRTLSLCNSEISFVLLRIVGIFVLVSN